MQLIRYDPFATLKQADKELFGNDWLQPTLVTDPSTLDMYTENGKIVAEVTLPNFKKEEIKVLADDHVLEISAEHQEKEEKNGERHYMLHESSSSFYRRITLPKEAETDEATASFADDKLTITMPLEENEESKEVPIT